MSKALAILPDQNEWNQIKEISTMAVKSGLLPASIKTSEQAAIIALKGRELGLPPMVAFAHINVIQGKPTCSAEIMLAYIYRDHPNAEIEIVERSETKCVIKAKRPNEAKFSTFTWDMDRAKKMGLDQKDNWKKQPGTMLFWRNITEMKRAKFPEVLMGIDYTPEELGAVIDDNGNLKDVSPRSQQPVNDNVVPIQTIKPTVEPEPEAPKIKNCAPQTPEEAKKWHEDKQAAEKTREQLGKEVSAERIRLGLTGEQVTAYIGDNFGKNPGDMTLAEMAMLVDLLKERKS